jgi:hypothetical protein
MGMKTPEQMAEEYCSTKQLSHVERLVLINGFLAGYQAAKDHAHAALEEAEAKIDELQTKLSDAGILTTEHLIDASKMVSSSATLNNWISVKDRLPDYDQLNLLWHKDFKQQFVGRRVDSNAMVPVMPRLCNEEEITHWMPLPEPPEE